MKPIKEIITNDFAFLNMDLVLYEEDIGYFREYWVRFGPIIISVKIPKGD